MTIWTDKFVLSTGEIPPVGAGYSIHWIHPHLTREALDRYLTTGDVLDEMNKVEFVRLNHVEYPLWRPTIFNTRFDPAVHWWLDNKEAAQTEGHSGGRVRESKRLAALARIERSDRITLWVGREVKP